jgi:thioredoxin reductase (NADPH)
MQSKVIIVGSGPAAYNAALYISELRPILFEGGYIGNNGPGGQLTTTTAVDNYPGFPHGTDGFTIVEHMKSQAISREVRVLQDTVVGVRREGGVFVVATDAGAEYRTEALVVATGASARRLLVPGTGDGEFWQKGVSSCAVCDGFAYRGKKVCVVGGGDAAMEEALYLAGIAAKVFLIHRRNAFRARADMVEKVRSMDNIEIITPYVLESAHGEEVLQRIVIRNSEDGRRMELELDGVFFGIGHDPNTGFLKGLDVELDQSGYIVTRDHVYTSVPGLFACGDVSDKKYRQAVTAAASGAIAGIKVKEYLQLNKAT